jgi:murein DD-endopeptidase MepM/ murein hydrolase activator NlpD
MHTKLKTALTAGIALVGIAAFAPSAQAAGQNGRCEAGEFCLYFNSGQQGSMVDMAGNKRSYGTGANCVKFITAGAGRGRCVKNNAASGWNRENYAVTVFYKSNWAGAVDTFVSGARANLTKTKNDNAGHVVGQAGNSRMARSLYKAPAHISAYFDGYLNTSGRHEGTDIARGVGARIYALTSGTVTNVVPGARGGNGLSTIAVYNASLNKTVVYLHSDPRNTLNRGEHVARGEHIGFEDWRGISSSSAAHTHVEMRPGRQTLAARSVGDPVLSNPIPTTFWMNRGYNICCA